MVISKNAEQVIANLKQHCQDASLDLG